VDDGAVPLELAGDEILEIFDPVGRYLNVGGRVSRGIRSVGEG
jgi:hypothetical protein